MAENSKTHLFDDFSSMFNCYWCVCQFHLAYQSCKILFNEWLKIVVAFSPFLLSLKGNRSQLEGTTETVGITLTLKFGICKCQQNFWCSIRGFFVCLCDCPSLCLLTVKAGRVSLYSPHWSGTCSVDQAVLQFSEICLFCPQQLGLKVCTTLPGIE